MVLVAHKDTRRVPEDQVRAVVAPEFTETWTPHAHSAVIDALEGACNILSVVPKRRQYSMSRDGGKMFGLWDLDLSRNSTIDIADLNHDTGLQIGFRSSIDKSMALTIAVGTVVFVCDNMAITGDWRDVRKHTGGFDSNELENHTLGALLSAVRQGRSELMHLRALQMCGYAGGRVAEAIENTFAVNLMDQDVFTFKQYPRLRSEILANVQRHGNNLYALWNAATATCRDESLFAISRRTSKLQPVINSMRVFTAMEMDSALSDN